MIPDHGAVAATAPFTLPVSELRRTDTGFAGGKGASLGEMAAADGPLRHICEHPTYFDARTDQS